MDQQTNVLTEFNEPKYKFASIGQRLLNVIIDIVVFYIVTFIAGVVAGLIATAMQPTSDRLLPGVVQLIFLFAFLAMYVLYYTLLEGSKGKTIGKMLTKTKAVQIDGSPLGYKKAFVRSLCRLVPFEFISVFFGGLMWHDQWTYSMTVQDN